MKEPLKMRYSLSLLVAGMVLGAWVPAQAQMPTYHLGRAPTQEEIRAADTAIGPAGKELPPGRGTAPEGAKIYAQKCAACHGPTGAEVTYRPELWPYETRSLPPPPMVGGQGTLTTPRPVRTIGNFWPVATTVWDFVNRAMPPGQEGSLSADQLYALTAFLLYRNGIIKETDIMDSQSLPKIQMPNRNGFLPPRPEWKPGVPRPFGAYP